MELAKIRAVVFDVLGTVVDEDATVERAARELFSAAALPAGELSSFLEEWDREMRARMDAVRSEGADWTDSDTIRGAALRDLLRSRGWDVPESAVEALATVGHRLDPWPDSVAALARLAERYAVVALTNGSVPQMTDTFVHAGLRWTLVLSADLARTFKPAAAMYQLPPTQLRIPTEQMLFVAAHPWDLDAAASHGYRTALIRRPGTSAEDDDRFDLSVATIGELAELVVIP
ncbi:haloacid dehalogenase type II [Nocardioides conyzicola]|uniref:Haloacid dehalogenase type II n=1 Tax=Nocardioides conyzicola TaxID=1651781 RepID=A0ABP8XRI9_9ACTN